MNDSRDFPQLHVSLLAEMGRLGDEERFAAIQRREVTDIIERIRQDLEGPAV